ncbi:hypothetical protein EYF80_018657 [Liparis tanakae]|uniref:Uncharacterized protein n=1 Tax=Liparis tanakae TaxID=230148 RepID=A0A4Z2HZI1_9TELE|nr:hypothetical protein EYF80_018657 [Liparis tanakae]
MKDYFFSSCLPDLSSIQTALNGCSLQQGLGQLLIHSHRSLFGTNTAECKSSLFGQNFKTGIYDGVQRDPELSPERREMRQPGQDRTENLSSL